MLGWAFKVSPTWLQDRVILDKMRFDRESVRGLSVTIAETREDLAASARVVHEAYVRRDLIAPHPSGMKFLNRIMVRAAIDLGHPAAGRRGAFAARLDDGGGLSAGGIRGKP